MPNLNPEVLFDWNLFLHQRPKVVLRFQENAIKEIHFISINRNVPCNFEGNRGQDQLASCF